VDNWAGELRLQGSFDAFEREHQVLIGIETNRSDVNRDLGSGFSYISSLDDYEGDIGDYPAFPAAEIATFVVTDRTNSNHAIYGQILFSVFDHTKLLVATRYDNSKLDNKWLRVDGSSFAGSTNDNAWTSRLGIIQTFNDNVNVYASYGQSFTPTSSIGRQGSLEPETGEGYELGLKTEWFNNKLAANLSVYQQELDNRPIDDPTNDSRKNEFFSISSGKHLTKGIELEVNGSFYPGWTLGGAASWMDNEFTEEGDPNKGLSFEGTFDKQASLFTSYQVQHGKLTGLAIGATFVHMGEISHIISGQQVYLDSYNRLDFNLSYQGLANWDMSLLVRNVTDEKYLNSANETMTHWGAPRSVLLQATYHFD
jgi:iron complex outermembrane receptor protein